MQNLGPRLRGDDVLKLVVDVLKLVADVLGLLGRRSNATGPSF
jgi:hypothetical protein